MGLNADLKDMAFTMSLIDWLLQEDPALVKRLLGKMKVRELTSADPREAADWHTFITVLEDMLNHPDER